jgi:hypothetical protein
MTANEPLGRIKMPIPDIEPMREQLIAIFAAAIPPEFRAPAADLVLRSIAAAVQALEDTLNAEPDPRLRLTAVGPVLGILASSAEGAHQQIPTIAEQMGVPAHLATMGGGHA